MYMFDCLHTGKFCMVFCRLLIFSTKFMFRQSNSLDQDIFGLIWVLFVWKSNQ